MWTDGTRNAGEMLRIISEYPQMGRLRNSFVHIQSYVKHYCTAYGLPTLQPSVDQSGMSYGRVTTYFIKEIRYRPRNARKQALTQGHIFVNSSLNSMILGRSDGVCAQHRVRSAQRRSSKPRVTTVGSEGRVGCCPLATAEGTEAALLISL